jgi:hypothetical protein
LIWSILRTGSMCRAYRCRRGSASVSWSFRGLNSRR